MTSTEADATYTKQMTGTFLISGDALADEKRPLQPFESSSLRMRGERCCEDVGPYANSEGMFRLEFLDYYDLSARDKDDYDLEGLLHFHHNCPKWLEYPSDRWYKFNGKNGYEPYHSLPGSQYRRLVSLNLYLKGYRAGSDMTEHVKEMLQGHGPLCVYSRRAGRLRSLGAPSRWNMSIARASTDDSWHRMSWNQIGLDVRLYEHGGSHEAPESASLQGVCDIMTVCPKFNFFHLSCNCPGADASSERIPTLLMARSRLAVHSKLVEHKVGTSKEVVHKRRERRWCNTSWYKWCKHGMEDCEMCRVRFSETNAARRKALEDNRNNGLNARIYPGGESDEPPYKYEIAAFDLALSQVLCMTENCEGVKNPWMDLHAFSLALAAELVDMEKTGLAFSSFLLELLVYLEYNNENPEWLGAIDGAYAIALTQNDYIDFSCQTWSDTILEFDPYMDINEQRTRLRTFGFLNSDGYPIKYSNSLGSSKNVYDLDEVLDCVKAMREVGVEESLHWSDAMDRFVGRNNEAFRELTRVQEYFEGRIEAFPFSTVFTSSPKEVKVLKMELANTLFELAPTKVLCDMLMCRRTRLFSAVHGLPPLTDEEPSAAEGEDPLFDLERPFRLSHIRSWR